jgi:small-conductance mechanosensitive channel
VTGWLAHATLAGAADEAPQPLGIQAGSPAPLVVENRTIVVLRASVLGHPPAERAEGARQRIERIIDQDGAGSVTSRIVPQGAIIEIDGAMVFAITPADVNEPAGDTVQSTAESAVQTLSLAVREAHERRDPLRMLKATGFAMLALLIYGVVLYGLMATKRRIGARLTIALQGQMEKIKLAGVTAVQPSQVFKYTQRLVTVLSWLLMLLATYIWLSYSLQLFPYTRPWGEQLRSYLVELVGSIMRGMVHALPNLFTVVVIVAITRFLSYLAGSFFRRVQAQRLRMGWLDEYTAGPTHRLFTVVLWLFALAMAYPYLPGAQTDAFKGLSVLVGLMVSIGASGLVGQAASGLILMYSRALHTGDYVKIGDSEGTVTELGMFATRLRTGRGEELILPNTIVLANTTRNYSRADAGRGFVLQVTVTIGYATPWRQVHAMLLEAARRTPDIVSDPAPFVIQAALSDFYVEYELVATATSEAPGQRARILSALNANVQDVFNEYGVQIMSPHYRGDPAQPQVVPKERWFEPPARIDA